MNPIDAVLDAETGVVTPCGRVVERRLSDMKGYYLDAAAEAGLIEREDPLLYHVFPLAVPEDEGQVLCGTSVIYPGRVGSEYYMTKGHFHVNALSAEVYHGLSGEGYLLVEARDGRTQHMVMRPGTVSYIPPGWAHRTVNIGDAPLVFFYAMPGDAGHDYGSIQESGFQEVVVERGRGPEAVRRERLA